MQSEAYVIGTESLVPAGGVSESSNRWVRNAAIDFVKGALVLVMVVYHSCNYFHHDNDFLRHLHFLPPAFIFIAGYLITHLQRTRPDRKGAGMRRSVRGLKLLAIFFALNLLTHSLVNRSYNQRHLGLEYFLDHLDSVLLTGRDRAAVFEVLLPIAYLLLLSGPLLLRFRRGQPWLLWLATTISSAACLVLALQGDLFLNLECLNMGLLGMVAGCFPYAPVERAARHIVLLASLYLCYSAVIVYVYPIYPLNILGVSLALLLLLALGLKSGSSAAWQRRVVLLGQYSLLGYILQMAILQCAFRLLRSFGIENGRFAIGLASTIIIMTATVELVQLIRRYSVPCDRVYRSVFA